MKVESQWHGERLDRTHAFAVRIGPSVRIRNGQGEWQQAYQNLDAFDSMMTHCADPYHAIELLMLRERMRNWRFFDHLGPHLDAPARQTPIGNSPPGFAGGGSARGAGLPTTTEMR